MAEEENQIEDAESAINAMFLAAVEALRTGDRPKAHDLLTRLLKTDQNNPDYWVWLSAAVDTQKERIYCLETSLKIDPENAQAKRGLVILGGLPADDSIPPFPIRKRGWEEKFEVEEEKPKGIKAAWGNPVARAFILLGIGILATGLVALGFLLPRTASRAPTRTPGPSPTFSPSPTSWTTGTPVVLSPTSTFIGPTPLWMLLDATYTSTPFYIETQHPAESQDAFRTALSSFKKGDYLNAIVQFQQVTTIEPNAADAHFYIGECYRALNKNTEAVAAYKKAVQVNQNFAPGYVGQAQALRAIDLKADVKLLLNQAIYLDPNYEAAFVERSLYYLDQNNLTEALADLESALTINPNDPKAYVALAQVQLKLGKNAEALESAIKANELDMTLLSSYLVLGQAYNANDQVEKALAPLKTYIQYIPNNAEALIILGTAYNATGDYLSAISVLDRAIGLERKNSEAYTQRGSRISPRMKGKGQKRILN